MAIITYRTVVVVEETEWTKNYGLHYISSDPATILYWSADHRLTDTPTPGWELVEVKWDDAKCCIVEDE